MEENRGSSVTRRKVLGTIGVTSSPLLGSVVSASNSDTVEIVTVRKGSEPKETDEVPKKWWDHWQVAERVRKRLQKRYAGDPGIEYVSLGSEKSTVQGMRRGQVRVYIDPDTSIKHNIPEQMEGVDVAVMIDEEWGPNGCKYSCCSSCNTGVEDPVPGGMQVHDNNGVGTLACRVYDEGNRELILTASHVMDYCKENIYGEKAYLKGSSGTKEIGEVYEYSGKRDFAAIRRTSSSDVSGYSGYIKNSNTSTVDGHVTENGVSTLIGYNETVYKVGASSCLENGTIKEKDVRGTLGCISDSYLGNVRSSIESVNGDSGALVYDKRYDSNLGVYYAAAINLNTLGAVDCSANSLGVAAYNLHDSYNYTFG